MRNRGYTNWQEEREEWEQDRALYEIELQVAFEEASNRRAFWLTGAVVCHVVTIFLLVTDWKALIGYAFAILAAAMLLWVHFSENEAARQDMREKLQLKFPDDLTPGPPTG